MIGTFVERSGTGTAGRKARWSGRTRYERAAGGARLGAGPEGARQTTVRSPAGGALLDSCPAAGAEVRRSTRAGTAWEAERCANGASCCSEAPRAAASDAQAKAPGEARPIKTAAHAAASAPRIVLAIGGHHKNMVSAPGSLSGGACLSSEQP